MKLKTRKRKPMTGLMKFKRLPRAKQRQLLRFLGLIPPVKRKRKR